MLKMESVHKVFNYGKVNENHALNGIDLELKDGDFVTIIGSNGAGKSTCFESGGRHLFTGLWKDYHKWH